MYLHKRDNIKWVSYEAPYITFTVETDKGNDKQVRRQIEQILTNSEIGENVVSDLRLKPIE